jgi:hypothetical protein
MLGFFNFLKQQVVHWSWHTRVKSVEEAGFTWPVGSGNGSVVRVTIERMRGIKIRNWSRALGCENGDKTEYDFGKNAL